MSISYTYDESNFPVGIDTSDTLSALLLAFEEDGVAGEHPDNTGGFYTDGVSSGLSGDTYAMANNDGVFAFSATGDLSYNFAEHALTGTLETLTLGGGLNNDGTVADDFITFIFDDPIVSENSGRDNTVHDVIWGLMNGSVEGADDSAGTINDGGLLAVLEDAGIASDVIGVSGSSSADLALAA